MTEIGRLYMKIAGREAGKFCVIVDTIKNNFVMIDGQVRRKKCNLAHLEPVKKTVDLKKGASHAEVVKAFEKIGLKIETTKPKTKKGAKPVRQRKIHQPKQASDQKSAAKPKESKEAKKETKKK